MIIVNDWDEISTEYLVMCYEVLKSKTWSREKLYCPYWFEKIYDLQAKIRE